MKSTCFPYCLVTFANEIMPRDSTVDEVGVFRVGVARLARFAAASRRRTIPAALRPADPGRYRDPDPTIVTVIARGRDGPGHRARRATHPLTPCTFFSGTRITGQGD